MNKFECIVWCVFWVCLCVSICCGGCEVQFAEPKETIQTLVNE